MTCELTKPLCKRKLMMKEGPFVKRKSCPLTEKYQCPLAPPKCPLLPEEKNNCPISKLIRNAKNDPICPLAQPGCPCDPKPPCPLGYDDIDDSRKLKKSGTSKMSCPANYPVNRRCSSKKRENERKSVITPCPNVLGPKCKRVGENQLHNEIIASNSSSISGKSGSDSSNHLTNSTVGSNFGNYKESLNDGLGSSNKMKQNKTLYKLNRDLNVPDSTLPSSRTFPCSECMGDILENSEQSPGLSLDCPYLKIINMCEESCLCDDVPPVNSGPICPFAPTSCPCCAAVRCPLTRIPDCPLVSGVQQIKGKSPACKCCCPIIPPPCTSNLPPQCRSYNNCNSATDYLFPMQCKKDKKSCSLEPSPSGPCPIQSYYSTEETYSSLKPKPILQVEKTNVPTLLVQRNVLHCLDDTLNELNKMCKCTNPPSPQMVNMVPITEQPSCIEQGDHKNCSLECPCEPPRTFHVPTCPKKNPPCLQLFPKSKNKGELVCPFTPRCPLGPVCPYPVEAKTEEQQRPLNFEDFSMFQQKWGSSPKIDAEIVTSEFDKCNTLKNDNENNNNYYYDKIIIKQKESAKTTKLENTNITNKVSTSFISKCPLNRMTSGKKMVCPYAPAPCPLDPIKPLSIKVPKICPFAPEPICPLMPKPLCPPTVKCAMKSNIPLPECPYAPSGCPLAPKKLCPPEAPTERSFDCPCKKPGTCPCLEPNPENECPCPDPIFECTCLNLVSLSVCPLTSKPECLLTPKLDQNCPLAVEKAIKNTSQIQSPCPLLNVKTEHSSNNRCHCINGGEPTECPCLNKESSNCPCSLLSNKPCSPNYQISQSACVIKTIINDLKRMPKELDCPVKIPPCEKFPEGRCPMEDLNLCDCDYPIPPCLELPQCGNTEATPQYCLKPNCSMGLSFPPIALDDKKENEKPLNYYKFLPTKPGREETKYFVEILDRAPNDYPFGLPKERENPNWNIIKQGKAYEKCKNVAETLKKRKPCVEKYSQFNSKDNPIDPETKLVMENRENQAKLEREVH